MDQLSAYVLIYRDKMVGRLHYAPENSLLKNSNMHLSVADITETTLLWPLLLTWINFNLSMDT